MAMEKMIKEMIREDNEWSEKEAATRLIPELVEDIKVKTCKVLTRAQSKKFLTEEGLEKMSGAKQAVGKEGEEILLSYKSRVLAFESFFDPEEENNLVISILESLKEVSPLPKLSRSIYSLELKLLKISSSQEEPSTLLGSKEDYWRSSSRQLRQTLSTRC